MTVVFALRLAGDQQWLFGLLLSAALAATVGSRLQPQPIYHALEADLSAPSSRQDGNLSGQRDAEMPF
jgi:H+/Cl- antiporter ClcA